MVWLLRSATRGDGKADFPLRHRPQGGYEGSSSSKMAQGSLVPRVRVDMKLRREDRDSNSVARVEGRLCHGLSLAGVGWAAGCEADPPSASSKWRQGWWFFRSFPRDRILPRMLTSARF